MEEKRIKGKGKRENEWGWKMREYKINTDINLYPERCNYGNSTIHIERLHPWFYQN